jgi:hypothetical protein
MCAISAISVVSHAAVAAGVRFGVGVPVIVMVSSLVATTGITLWFGGG